MTDARTELADAVSALVDPIRHAETYVLRAPYPGGPGGAEVRVHRTVHAPLLDQLARAIEPSSSAKAGSRGYESSPSARLDAIDMLRRIAIGAGVWLIDLGLPPPGDTAGNLRALVGADLDVSTLAALARDATRWVTWARIVTGWDVPALRPNVVCPACSVRGGLRLRVDPVSAACVSANCGATWTTDAEVAMLAECLRDGADTGELERIAG